MGSEMCIRDRSHSEDHFGTKFYQTLFDSGKALPITTKVRLYELVFRCFEYHTHLLDNTRSQNGVFGETCQIIPRCIMSSRNAGQTVTNKVDWIHEKQTCSEKLPQWPT